MAKIKVLKAASVAIGKQIKFFRLRAGVTQEGLGQKLDVTFQQVQKYENGENRISCNKLLDLCTALECTPNDLLGYNDATIQITHLAERLGNEVKELLQDQHANQMEKVNRLLNNWLK
jgi:transcriptional regulator with XRE-family HTH domain